MKPLYFFLLLLTEQLFIGLTVNYSVTKKDISEELDVSEETFSKSDFYVGIVEMLNLIGRFLSTVAIVLFPPNLLKLTYFVFLIVQVFSMTLLCGIHFFRDSVEPLLAISLLILGLARGTYTFPYLLLFYHFQNES